MPLPRDTPVCAMTEISDGITAMQLLSHPRALLLFCISLQNDYVNIESMLNTTADFHMWMLNGST